MKSFIGPQELARRFNEDEAVWRRYCLKRGLHRLRGSSLLFPEDFLDRLDWLESEGECRERRYVERPFDEAVQTH